MLIVKTNKTTFVMRCYPNVRYDSEMRSEPETTTSSSTSTCAFFLGAQLNSAGKSSFLAQVVDKLVHQLPKCELGNMMMTNGRKNGAELLSKRRPSRLGETREWPRIYILNDLPISTRNDLVMDHVSEKLPFVNELQLASE